MDLIQMTRALGEAIQKDERYLAMVRANEANEKDEGLNELMGEVRLIQMNYQREAAKPEADEAKLDEYDKEFNRIYSLIMENPNMKEFQKARNEIDEMMKYITGILSMCVHGDDPATCEPQADHNCGGSCSSCSGC